jgi:hypothetical protein
MRLRRYLNFITRETDAQFAVRSGLARSTVNTIAAGGAASIESALKIIDATDGRVELDDLVADSTRRTG